MKVDDEFLRQWLLKERKKVMGNKNDLVVPVTGPERSGKSTIAFHFARLMDPSFDVTRQTVFHAKHFKRRSVELPRHSGLILDEAIFGGFSRRSMSGDNVDLVRHLTVSGDRYNFNFICWPSKQWLDSVLRDWRSTWNVHVLRRGIAQIRQFHDGETIFDPPKILFTFTFPEATGEEWNKYLTMKDEFVKAHGRGDGGDKGVEFLNFKEQISDGIAAIVQDLVRHVRGDKLGPSAAEAMD